MTAVHKIISDHKAGKIDLDGRPIADVAKSYDCSSATVSAARKKLGIIQKSKWREILAAHERGEIDLTEWSWNEIREKFKCSNDTVRTAINKGKIKRINTSKMSELERKDRNAARYYRWKFRKQWGVLKKWGVIPERVGKTPNEWKAYVKGHLGATG